MAQRDQPSANGSNDTPAPVVGSGWTNPDAAFATLRARYRPPAPDPGFVARLEDELMTASQIVIRGRFDRYPDERRHGSAPARIVPSLPQLASAALVLLTLAATAAAFGLARSSGPAQLPPKAPAAIAATPAPGNAVAAFVWESAGDAVEPLSNVGHLAIDPAGNVWASDPGHDRFQIFSPDGVFLEAWGTSGSGDGEFDFRGLGFPTAAVAFAADGSFYVVDGGNHRVQKFAPDRSFVKAWGSKGAGPGQFKSLLGVAVDRAGNVYVIDNGRYDVQVFDADGTYLRTIGEYGFGDGQFLLSVGGGVAVDPAGNVWVSDTSTRRLQVFSPDGNLLAVREGGPRANDLGAPSQIAFDDEGRVFVASGDTGEVQVFAADGAFLGSWGRGDAAGWAEINPDPGSLLSPSGIAVDGAGDVYVSDIYRERVLKFRLLPLLASPTAP